MTDDPAMLRLLAAAEGAGSKVILVGDHRQIGAVGPGGSLEALLARHTDAVHVLDENVRQSDPEERAALGHLRAGNVEQAVNWYAQHDRIATAPTRDQALDGVVAAWVADIAPDKDTTMMAWRRANVAALNARARAAMTRAGRLVGPELVVGSTAYQAGDRVVTLAPSAGGRLVTSQRGEVTAVESETGTLVVRMDDGRTHTLGADQMSPDLLAHGYATTVHRSQGATFDAAHLYADGVGRELGYVAMSRARQATQVHAVADNIDQAVEDLAWDWSRERRQTWAIDTGTPDTEVRHPLEIEVDKAEPPRVRAVLGRARLRAERTALAASTGDRPDPPSRRRLAQLDREIDAFDQRVEPRRGSPVGRRPSAPVEAPAPELRHGPGI